GSNDPSIRIRDFNLKFVPGALAAEYVSSDARTFRQPPASWHPGSGDDSDGAAQFGGSPQSLIGDFIHAGVTGTAGHVNEPYLDATIRPDILFPAYLSGADLAEAFYAAMPYLSWQTVVIGDPLCAPFRNTVLTGTQIDPGIDPDMLLPRFFAERRLETAGTRVRAAAVATVRAEALAEAKDKAGTLKALTDAVEADPHFTTARMTLALSADADGRFDDAIVQYRAVLDYDGANAVALNNLAYSLAVNKHAPADAVSIAERAVTASHDNPAMLDTLAWTEHLLGRDGDALGPIAGARDGSPNDPEIRLHAAAIYAALKDSPRAASELATALKLNPALADRDDVKALQIQLRGGR
ncbi:MAG: TIGR03790 family protein, partial [Vicinamibacterales bacterium]